MCVCTLLSDYVVAVFVACGILFSALTLQWPTAVQFYDSSILIDHLLCISPFVGGGSAGYILVPSSLCSHLVLLSAPGVLDTYWQVSIILSTLTLLSTFFVGIRRPSSSLTLLFLIGNCDPFPFNPFLTQCGTFAATLSRLFLDPIVLPVTKVSFFLLLSSSTHTHTHAYRDTCEIAFLLLSRKVFQLFNQQAKHAYLLDCRQLFN